MARDCCLLWLFVVGVASQYGCDRPPRFDDRGGTILVYEVTSASETALNGDDRLLLVNGMRRRLDPDGAYGIEVEYVVGRETVNGSTQIEVRVPGFDGRLRLKVKSLITFDGKIEFLLLAHREHDVEVIDLATSTDEHLIEREGATLARWVEVSLDGTGDLRYIAGEQDVVRNTSRENTADGSDADEPGDEVLLMVDQTENNIGAQHLDHATQSVDSMGRPCLSFSMNDRGAALLGALTSQNIGRRLGIILDDQLLSAPTIQSTISDYGQITGRFTHDEVDLMVALLQASWLPVDAKMTFVSQEVVHGGNPSPASTHQNPPN